MTSHDIVVVGGGPAGLAAATRAAESGARVLLIDESPTLGGQIWRGGHHPAAHAALGRFARSGAVAWSGAAVIDARPDGEGYALTVERDDEATVVHCRAVVLATGARELFVPFPGWTLPGVYGVGGAQALLKSGASFANKRVVIAGTGPLLLPVAASLVRARARVSLVAEQAPFDRVAAFAFGLWRRPVAIVEATRYRLGFLRSAYRTGRWVTAAHGDTRVREVDVTDGRTTRTVSCDVLCTGYGLVPSTELARLLGCRVNDGVVVVDERQMTSRPNVFCAGEPTGIGGVDLARVEGEIAGLAACAREAPAVALHAARARLRGIASAMAHAFAVRAEVRACATAQTLVCRCEDVPLGALDPAWTPRQAKLYTRVGMGPCQGRVCGAALSVLRGWTDDTVRVPVSPARVTTLQAIE